MQLIVLTDGFERFEKASELCSYARLTPIIRQSGSSVRSRPRVSKMSNSRLREALFMCSFAASKLNKACRDIYNRILAKGKSKKNSIDSGLQQAIETGFFNS